MAIQINDETLSKILYTFVSTLLGVVGFFAVRYFNKSEARDEHLRTRLDTLRDDTADSLENLRLELSNKIEVCRDDARRDTETLRGEAKAQGETATTQIESIRTRLDTLQREKQDKE